MKRRHFIKAFLAGLTLPLQALAALWNKPAFEAEALPNAVQALQINAEEHSDQISIIAPEKAENGAVVQVEIQSNLANTEAIALFVEGNPTPLIANFMLHTTVKPRLVTRIKMAATSDVKVIAKVGQRYYTNSKKVVVLEDGCGGGDIEGKFETSIKMRAKIVDALTELKAIIVHPMSTGRAKGDKGNIIPAHFIQTMQVSLNGLPIIEAQLGTGIAKNPYFTFYLEKASAGQTVELKWQDNQAYQGEGKVSVSVA